MSNMRVTHMLYTDAAAPAPTAFRFTILTTGAGQTFSLPLEALGTYNCDVDWGDTNSDTITVWNQAEVTHTYAVANTYEIKIEGTITGWRFNGGGDDTKMRDIKEWGPLNLGNNGNYFYGCKYLSVSATDVLDLTGTTNLRGMFWYCTNNLTTIPSINSWNVSNVTDMALTFSRCSVFNQDINSWNTSSVTTMSFMFARAFAFNGNISSWDISSVTRIDNMFLYNQVFNQNVGSWNTSNVILMNDVFDNCHVFNQDISGWDTSSVTDIDGMFNWAHDFNQDISSWITSSVITMASMFNHATAFNQDIGSWNTSSVTKMNTMFNQALSFNQDISGWDTSSVVDMEGMFGSVTIFNQDISGWDTSSVVDMVGMFDGATAFDQNLSTWNIAALTDATDMFQSIALSTVNYNALLVGWEGQVEKPNVTFSGGNSTYNAGAPATARAALQGSGWAITDGGQV